MTVRQKIIINSTPQEARVALLENDNLAEIHIERAQQRNIAGNIYLGRVNRVLPGMQAAFVDIGLEKAGFIHASDVFGGPLPDVTVESDTTPGIQNALLSEFDIGGVEHDPEEKHSFAESEGSDDANNKEPSRTRRRRSRPENRVPLEQKLKKNQEILVQIAKEPIGTKGPRLTAHLSLPRRQWDI